MARELVLPDAWVEQEVNITYIGAGKTNDITGSLLRRDMGTSTALDKLVRYP